MKIGELYEIYQQTRDVTPDVFFSRISEGILDSRSTFEHATSKEKSISLILKNISETMLDNNPSQFAKLYNPFV